MVEALGLEEPDPGRPFDGRHDRGRDGGPGAQRRLPPGADLPGRTVAGRPPDRPTCSRCCPSSCPSTCFTTPKRRRRDDRGLNLGRSRSSCRPSWCSNARQLGMAGKLLFPIPERGLAERLYRIKAKTLIDLGRFRQADFARLRSGIPARHLRCGTHHNSQGWPCCALRETRGSSGGDQSPHVKIIRGCRLSVTFRRVITPST